MSINIATTKKIQWNNVGNSTYHFHLLLLFLLLLLLLLLGFGRDGQNSRGYLPWEERAEMFPPRETIQWVCCRNDWRPPADRGIKTSAWPSALFSLQPTADGETKEWKTCSFSPLWTFFTPSSPFPSPSPWAPPGQVGRRRWRACSWSDTAPLASEGNKSTKVRKRLLCHRIELLWHKSQYAGVSQKTWDTDVKVRLTIRTDQRTFRSLLSPIMAVGVKAKDRKWDRGNQNQNCVKTSSPTTEGMWVWPVLDCREMVTLRPPGEQREPT